MGKEIARAAAMTFLVLLCVLAWLLYGLETLQAMGGS